MRPVWLALAAVALVVAGAVTGVKFREGFFAQGASKEHIKASSAVELVDLRGNPATLPFGERAFLINFWATWCPPCRHELPLLDQVSVDCPGSVIGIAVDEHELAKKYVEDEGFSMESLIAGLNGGVKLSEAFGNADMLMPYSVLIGGEGEMVATKQGPFASESEIKDFLGLAHEAQLCPA